MMINVGKKIREQSFNEERAFLKMSLGIRVFESNYTAAQWSSQTGGRGCIVLLEFGEISKKKKESCWKTQFLKKCVPP